MNPLFRIRDIPIYSDLILAPMEGYSDFPFRKLTRGFGSGISCAEFVNAMDVLNGHPYLLKQRLAFDERQRPVAFQIYDSEPERIIRAANLLRKLDPDMIDINMGCSVRAISGRGAGAGLLQSPEKIALIFSSLTRQLDIPITGKIRLGWDNENQNYQDVVRIIEDNGGAMITVHARTRQQGFSGSADWQAIARIKQILRIPVVGNGDVRTISDIQNIKKQTGCDGVMIGRAAIGNPWLFSRIDRSTLPVHEMKQVISNHLSTMVDFYGESRGTTLFRKHLIEYIHPLKKLTREERKSLLTCTDPTGVIDLLETLLFA